MKIKHDSEGPRTTHECDDCKPLPFDKIINRHTPTPWTLLGGMIGEPYKIQAHSEHHEIVTPCKALKNADAAFIVRAVNVHEELVTTLKETLDALYNETIDTPHRPWINSVKERARQAIAKAEGK